MSEIMDNFNEKNIASLYSNTDSKERLEHIANTPFPEKVYRMVEKPSAGCDVHPSEKSMEIMASILVNLFD